MARPRRGEASRKSTVLVSIPRASRRRHSSRAAPSWPAPMRADTTRTRALPTTGYNLALVVTGPARGGRAAGRGVKPPGMGNKGHGSGSPTFVERRDSANMPSLEGLCRSARAAPVRPASLPGGHASGVAMPVWTGTGNYAGGAGGVGTRGNVGHRAVAGAGGLPGRGPRSLLPRGGDGAGGDPDRPGQGGVRSLPGAGRV